MDAIFSIPTLIAILVAGSVLLLGMTIAGRMGGAGRVRDLRRRVGVSEAALDHSAPSATAQKVSRVVQELGQKLGPQEEERTRKTRIELIRAGLRKPNSALVFQGVKVGLALALPGVFFLLRLLVFDGLSLQWSLFFAVFFSAAGLYLPELWLRNKVSKRQATVMDELPDALDLLVVCVEAGMGLDQAIHRVSTELAASAPVISSELHLLTLELRAGRSRQEALRDLAERVGLEDLGSLVTLLVQADVFGISVARTLRVYSDTLRTKRYQRAEELAAKLPVKLLIPLICCILPALFVVIMGPAGIMLADVFSKMR